MAESNHRSTAFQEASAAFREHLPDLNTPRFQTAAKQDPYEYSKFFQDNHAPPWLFALTQAWAKLYEEPFKGVTSDGTVKEGLFEVKDEGVDIENIVKKAEDLLSQLDEEKSNKLRYPVGAKEWRAWSNPEMLLRPFGLRLEEGMLKFPFPPIDTLYSHIQSLNPYAMPSTPSSRPRSPPKATKKRSPPCA